MPNEVWIGTPSFDTQVESAQPKLLKFLKDKDIQNVEYYQGNKMKTIYLKNGSKATFKSYEQATDKWAGAAKRLIWFDEEPPHNIWTEAVVRHGAGIPLDIIFTLTPINGMTWIYDELWTQAEAKGVVIKTPSWDDNKHLTADQISTMTSMLSPEELEVRRYGRFVRRIGLVCNWWRRDVHLEDLSQFNPRGLTNWIGIDFGFSTASTAALFVALKGADLYVYDGIYEKNLTTPELANRLNQKLPKDLMITGWVADSASADDIEELKRYNFPVEGIKKETGSAQINWDDFRAKKLAEIGAVSLNNTSRLHISKTLISDINGKMINWFANEAENLRWKSVRNADGTQAKSVWDDQPKDAIDALSYILVRLPMSVPESVKYVNSWSNKAKVPKDNLFDSDGFYI